MKLFDYQRDHIRLMITDAGRPDDCRYAVVLLKRMVDHPIEWLRVPVSSVLAEGFFLQVLPVQDPIDASMTSHRSPQLLGTYRTPGTDTMCRSPGILCAF